jgi:FKBP-type peptidyl-prolyl cis-trans isomerase FkpA
MKRINFLPLALLLSTSLFLTAACTEQARAPVEDADTADMFQLDTKLGTGAEAIPGQQVSVHYTGWLYDKTTADHHGQKFDSSRDRGQPFEFLLGAEKVIKGWDQGIEGMKVGGQRSLIIPARLGYGASGSGKIIPPNATLVFDVELVGVRDNPSVAKK